MPGAWPGSTVVVSPDAGQNKRKVSVAQILPPVDVPAKDANTSRPKKSGSESSVTDNAVKSNTNNEHSTKTGIINERKQSKRNDSLIPAATSMVNGNISARGSITSVGAVLAGATLAASTGSNEVATQLLSPEGSLRVKNPNHHQNQSENKGIYNI